MSSDGVGILVLHAAIFCFQYIAMRLFPTQKKAISGTYFIFLPVGSNIFMDPGPVLTLIMVFLGVVFVLYFAHKNVLVNTGQGN